MDNTPTPTAKWVLLVLWQLTWVIAVGGASHDLSYPGILAGVITFGVFLYLFRTRRHTIFAALAIASVGCLMDFVLLSAGVMNAQGIPQNLPVWLIGLWLAFSTAPSSALYWLAHRPLLQILFGGVGGLLAWWSAANLGAVTLTTNAWWALPLAWALFTPAVFAIQNLLQARSVRLVGTL